MSSSVPPRYPITVRFGDGDVWTLDTPNELATSLEWFDSRDPSEDAVVTDAEGRLVDLLVERQHVVRFELK